MFADCRMAIGDASKIYRNCSAVKGAEEARTPCALFAALTQPVGDLRAHVAHLVAERGDVLAELAEHRAEALGVELERVAGLLTDVGLLVAPPVFAALDAVVLAALHPAHDLRDASDGVGVGRAQLVEEAAHS